MTYTPNFSKVTFYLYRLCGGIVNSYHHNYLLHLVYLLQLLVFRWVRFLASYLYLKVLFVWFVCIIVLSLRLSIFLLYTSYYVLKFWDLLLTLDLMAILYRFVNHTNMFMFKDWPLFFIRCAVLCGYFSVSCYRVKISWAI